MKSQPQLQHDLFPEAVAAASEAAPKKSGRRTARKVEATELLGHEVAPLVPLPLWSRLAASWALLFSALLLVGFIHWFNLLWHAGHSLFAVFLLMLCGISVALVGRRIWFEWRAVSQLNQCLQRRLVAQQVLAGAPLVDRRMFCLNLLPPAVLEMTTDDKLEQWLDSHASEATDPVFLQEFLREFVAPWQTACGESLIKRLPAEALERASDPLSWAVMLQRWVLVVDEVLAAHGIDTGWVVRWRVSKAAIRHLAHAGLGNASRSPVSPLSMLAATVHSLLLPGAPS